MHHIPVNLPRLPFMLIISLFICHPACFAQQSQTLILSNTTGPRGSTQDLVIGVPGPVPSRALGVNDTALGQGAVAGNGSNANNTAVGQGSAATGGNSTALGQNARATGTGSVAIGKDSLATNSVAVGTGAVATGGNGVALGDGAQALGANSVALGSGTIAGEANTVSVGGRKIVDVAPGVAPTDAVNVIQLNSSVNTLYGQIKRIRRNSYGGIAGVAAIATTMRDPRPGKMTVNIGTGIYGSQTAVAAAVAYKSRSSRVRYAGAIAQPIAAPIGPVGAFGVGWEFF